MDIKKFCEDGLEECAHGVAEERLSGNVVKKAHWIGGKVAYQSVLAALQENIEPANSAEAAKPNKQMDAISSSVECNHCNGWVKIYWKFCPNCGGKQHH